MDMGSCPQSPGSVVRADRARGISQDELFEERLRGSLHNGLWNAAGRGKRRPTSGDLRLREDPRPSMYDDVSDLDL